MRTFAIIRRDLKKFFRNPLILIANIVMPIVYLLVVGNTVQGNLKNLPLLVVDQDHGHFAARIYELIQAIEAGEKTIKASYINDISLGYSEVANGRYSALLIIPPDFTKKMVRSDNPEVALFMDNVDIFSANAIYGSLSKALSYIKREHIPIRINSESAVLRSIEIYKKIDYDQSLVPGIVIMSIFLGAMGSGVFNLIMDKFLGVHESYLVTPLTKWDIVAGMILSGVVLTTSIAMIVFTIAVNITGIHYIGADQYILILFVIVLTALGLLGMMFFILSRADHPRIVGILGGFLNVILFFPSGAIYPASSFPEWLQSFSRINPETYAVHALRSLMFKGGNIEAIKYDLVFLSLFTVIMLFLSTVTFKRRV